MSTLSSLRQRLHDVVAAAEGTMSAAVQDALKHVTDEFETLRADVDKLLAANAPAATAPLPLPGATVDANTTAGVVTAAAGVVVTGSAGAAPGVVVTNGTTGAADPSAPVGADPNAGGTAQAAT